MRSLRLLLLTALLTGFAISSASAAKKQTLEQLGLEILETIQSFYPVRSTEMGIHVYDHRLTDYTSASGKAMVKKLKSLEKKLYKFPSAKLNPNRRTNYKLLKSNLDIALLDLQKIGWHRKSPQLYIDDAVNGIYFLILSKHAPPEEKIVTIIRRFKAVPKLFATARKRIKNPPAIYVEIAKESIKSALRFYREVTGELMKNFPERADEISRVSTAARESMSSFEEWLNEINPSKDASFAIGKENFDYILEHHYFLPFDSDSLLIIGQSLLADARAAYTEYEKRVETAHQNGSDSIFVPKNFTRDDILNYYNWETSQVATFISQNEILSIPDDISPVTVIETPPFLRSLHGGIAYQPAGPFDSEQQGYFYVRPVPDDLDRRQLEARFRYVHRRGFKGSVVHEAFPGHHLQLQLAGQNPEPIRKWQMNIMMIEGWALYCEEMMYKNGLFGDEDPAQWLGVLGGIRFRAARIVADVKLHTGQFSYNQCVAWMTEQLDITSESGQEYIRKEVRRYTMTPTYQMSYLMGKREIMRLRKAMEKRDGDDFTERKFHDALLAEGSVPPTLMWDMLALKRP